MVHNLEENDIIDILKRWNKNYRAGDPEVPDSVYDELLDRLPEDHPYRLGVEPEVLYKNHVRHSKPLLSMKKAKTDEDIHKWLCDVEAAANHLLLDHKNVWININHKLDGIACVLENNVFATRGNGIEGNDVTSILDKGVELKIHSEFDFPIEPDRILGELVVKLPYFEANLSKSVISHGFSNARNFVSGAVMSETLNNLTKKAFNDNAIVFQSYAMLPSFSYSLDSIRDNFREAEKELWKSDKYLIDGVILMVVNKDVQEVMGETDSYPNYAIALKPKDDIYTSKVVKIHWNTGRTGKVTPRIEIEPVDIDGVIVTFASGHNARMVMDMGVKEGATVEIIRSGSVIPYIVRVVK